MFDFFKKKEPKAAVVENKHASRQPSDEDILKYEDSIREAQAASQPLVSPVLPLSLLIEEYREADPNFLVKISKLEEVGGKTFSSMRRCRGDGNCFYRAVAFGLLECLIEKRGLEGEGKDNGKEAYEGFIEELKKRWDELCSKAGFDKGVYEDFAEAFWSALSLPDASSLESSWQSDEYSANLLLVYLRLLTSAEIRTNPDFYTAFLTDCPLDLLNRWCEANVEAMNVDADQLQVIAAVRALNVGVNVANIAESELQLLKFGGDELVDVEINLLYRPGHYDLLYQ